MGHAVAFIAGLAVGALVAFLAQKTAEEHNYEH